MAKEKSIKGYQMYIDTQSDRYSMKYRRLWDLCDQRGILQWYINSTQQGVDAHIS